MLAALREQAYAMIENQPEYLLEHAGGPRGIEADIISARLVGFDDEIDEDWLIQDIVGVLRRPIVPRSWLSFDGAPLLASVATYELQSNYATTTVANGAAPVEWLRFLKPPDFIVRLLFLRYRRVS